MADNNPNYPIAVMTPDAPLSLAPGLGYTFQAGGIVWLDVFFRSGYGTPLTYRLNNNQIVRFSGTAVDHVILEASGTQGTITYFIGGEDVTYFPTAPDEPMDVVVGNGVFSSDVANGTGSTTTQEMGTGTSKATRIFYTLAIPISATTLADIPIVQIVDKISGDILAQQIGGGSISGVVDFVYPGARIAIVYANPDTIAHQISATYLAVQSSAEQ